MPTEIEKDKRLTLATLQKGIAGKCADDLTEAMINMENGTCDYLELIPVLEEIARVEWFYYFDDNGAGGMPHADLRRKTNFKSWALTAIESIRANALFESTSAIHRALKSNDTNLIKSTLEQLKGQNGSPDKTLIPILEKIARKDVYKKYSYIGGFETDCQLGELARAGIQLIVQHSPSTDPHDEPASDSSENLGKCSVCSSLPDDLTVNTGREEFFPPAFSQLLSVDNDYRAEFRRCPGCRAYFNWIDMPQMYGSGNNDEERLVRISPEKSHLLDKLFTADLSYRPTSTEIEEYIHLLPVDLLVPALRFHLHGNDAMVTAFVPRLLILLGKNNDSSLWSFLNGYISKNRQRAAEVLDAFGSGDEYPPNRLIQILHQCLKLVK